MDAPRYVWTPAGPVLKQHVVARQQFMAQLDEQGLSVSQWCRQHRFSQSLAYRALRGGLQGRYGQGREICLAMGLPVRNNFEARQE